MLRFLTVLVYLPARVLLCYSITQSEKIRMVGRRAFGSKDSNPHEDSWGKDIETGLKKRPRFKDAVELAMAHRTTHQLKKQLNEGIDGSDYKKYRKSDEEVRGIAFI